jgi:ElaB/YqjD/DUF883 family membrane-anchored ribosome-binding protein
LQGNKVASTVTSPFAAVNVRIDQITSEIAVLEEELDVVLEQRETTATKTKVEVIRRRIEALDDSRTRGFDVLLKLAERSSGMLTASHAPLGCSDTSCSLRSP